MAKDTRTLTLKILADVDKLNKSLNQGENDVKTFGDKVEAFGKKMGAAFAAAGAAAAAYAGKLAIDGVKAALEDEQAQVRLATALKSAAGATQLQIDKTEDFISKMQLATGVADTDLRNAMGRLTLSTNSVSKSQELLSLALDISKARGLSLETVSNALGKAYDGQTTALARLGLGFSSAELKGKSFDDITKNLANTFGGAAAANANTFQGRIDRLKQAFDESKEAVGARLLPIIEKMITIFIQNVIPALGKVAEFFRPISDAIERNRESFQKFGQLLQDYVIPILAVGFAGALKVVANVAGFVIDIIGKIAGAITTVVNGAIDGINALIKRYNALPLTPNIPTIGNISAPKITTPSISTSIPKTSVPTITPPTITGGGSTGGTGTAAKTTSGAAFDLSSIPVTGDASGTAGAKILASLPKPSNSITVNIGVAGDPEGTARAVVDVLNKSLLRGTGGLGGLVDLG
jgi:hypothetical protein